MTRCKTTIVTKTIPTEIYINGNKIHGGMLKIKYIPKTKETIGGIAPNQTFIHGTPLNGYDPNISSDLYGKNGIDGLGVSYGTNCGNGIFDWIPVIGPVLGKITGLGIDEKTYGGFPWLAAIPAVLSGIDLISGLFKGKGFLKESQICDMPGHPCDIEFKTGYGLYKTKANLNGMHKALLADIPFLHQIHREGQGISFRGGNGVQFPQGRGISFRGGEITPQELERSKLYGEEMNALIGLGFQNMKNINLA